MDVSDHLRAIFFKYSGYNEAKAESMFIQFRKEQLAHLNIRSGPRRIVKVIPKVKKDTGAFPDSKVKNIPQWRLKKEKKFVLIEVVEPDGRG